MVDGAGLAVQAAEDKDTDKLKGRTQRWGWLRRGGRARLECAARGCILKRPSAISIASAIKRCARLRGAFSAMEYAAQLHGTQ